MRNVLLRVCWNASLPFLLVGVFAADAAAQEERRQGVPVDREERRQGVPVDREERRQGVPVDREERRQGVPADREERRQGVPADRDVRLVQAAKAAEQAQAIALLGGGADANQRSADGTTALHWATRNNDAMLVDRLLKAGARPHPENRYGVTPIALACESGSAAIVERLLKAGVSANATGPSGETALHTCAHAGNTAGVRVLLAARASVDPGDNWRGQTPLMWAAAEGHPETMQALIDGGADVNARSTI